jgi:hypothetical protein
MIQVGFEPTIPVFERAKTVHALDHEATVISNKAVYTAMVYAVINVVLFLKIKV